MTRQQRRSRSRAMRQARKINKCARHMEEALRAHTSDGLILGIDPAYDVEPKTHARLTFRVKI